MRELPRQSDMGWRGSFSRLKRVRLKRRARLRGEYL
nr:MAG TPA: hypothetical protein [Bacteriophage sp.]